MKVIKEILGWLDGESAGSTSTVIKNVSCDVVSLQVWGNNDGDFKIFVEGGFVQSDYNTDYEPLGIIPLENFHLIEGEDGITEDGVYEVAIEGVKFVRLRMADDSVGTAHVEARFVSTIL